INTKSLPPVLAERLLTLELTALFVSKSNQADHLETAKNTLNILVEQTKDPKYKQLKVWVFGATGDGSSPSYEEFIALGGDACAKNMPKNSTFALSDPFAIMFTSGFSGRSRTCRIRNENIMCKLQYIAKHLELTSDSTMWLPVSIFQTGF